MRKKRIAMLLLEVMLLVGFAFPVLALADDIRVYVDNSEVIFWDQKPVLNADNRILVPIRYVSQALGGEVKWFGESQRVEIKYGEQKMWLTVGENFAWWNGEKKDFDTTTIIMNNRVMIPLRFVSECLGAYVYWNGAKREVFITKDYLQQHGLKGAYF
ncbi:MAG TPA: copper amine oxidase N-terminal domain-containing protein [Clostridia bacterium]|nr:copper amine oxidase N-terminal domain-containing protein [Clostridia bacterium]